MRQIMYTPVFVTPDKSVGTVTDRDPVIRRVPRAVGDCLVSIIMLPHVHILQEDQPVERFAGIMDTRSSSKKRDILFVEDVPFDQYLIFGSY